MAYFEEVIVAEIVNHKCDVCSDRNTRCCKGCFEEDDKSIFIGLTEEELYFLTDGKQQIKYNPGETIVKQNTSSTFVVCIREGLAKVYVEGIKGKNSIVRLISKHDFVTGGGLFNGNIQKFTISAVTPVVCCLIDSSKLVKLFAENNQFAVEMLRFHIKQNNYLLNKLVNQTQKYMPGRVADTLLYLKNEIFEDSQFTIPLTRQELAEMSNMTKESFVRILQEFKSSGFIKTKGNEFLILNESALLSISKNG
ncbi:MAG: Crp/Fnr family transcriptional regulator [Prolixibacteraceae bacterium]|nr:Crp/Fnr family transcriptional regulator [Prolixibacteraceae bacterium]